MNSRLMLVAYVALGGGVGTAARYLLTLFVQQRAGAGFPVATLLVNVTGSFLLGLLMRYALESTAASPEARLLLTTGFCGGFTTFSTFSYETARLIEDGEWRRGVAYIAASVILSIGGLFLGFALARGLSGAPRS
jgi:CrcB protein